MTTILLNPAARLIRVLFVLMALCMASPGAWAQEPSGNWIDVNNAATQIANANGWDGSTEQKAIEIKTAAELAYLAKQVNAGATTLQLGNGNLTSNAAAGFQYVYFKLTDNIDLSTHYWTPIGKTNNPFNGMFDGNYKVISGLNINETLESEGDAYIGLFGLSESFTIKNLGIELGTSGINITNTAATSLYVGTIVGQTDGHIFHCFVKGGKITVNNNNSNATSVKVGGMVGATTGGYGIENCYTTCNVSVTSSASTNSFYVGGIAGEIGPNYSFTVSYATGSISGVSTTDADANVGGLIGNFKGSTFQFNIALNKELTSRKNTSDNSTVGRLWGNTYEVLESNYSQPNTVVNGADNNIKGTDLTANNFIGKGANQEAFTRFNGGGQTNWDFGDNSNLPILLNFADGKQPVIPRSTYFPDALDLKTLSGITALTLEYANGKWTYSTNTNSDKVTFNGTVKNTGNNNFTAPVTIKLNGTATLNLNGTMTLAPTAADSKALTVMKADNASSAILNLNVTVTGDGVNNTVNLKAAKTLSVGDNVTLNIGTANNLLLYGPVEVSTTNATVKGLMQWTWATAPNAAIKLTQPVKSEVSFVADANCKVFAANAVDKTQIQVGDDTKYYQGKNTDSKITLNLFSYAANTQNKMVFFEGMEPGYKIVLVDNSGDDAVGYEIVGSKNEQGQDVDSVRIVPSFANGHYLADLSVSYGNQPTYMPLIARVDSFKCAKPTPSQGEEVTITATFANYADGIEIDLSQYATAMDATKKYSRFPGDGGFMFDGNGCLHISGTTRGTTAINTYILKDASSGENKNVTLTNTLPSGQSYGEAITLKTSGSVTFGSNSSDKVPFIVSGKTATLLVNGDNMLSASSTLTEGLVLSKNAATPSTLTVNLLTVSRAAVSKAASDFPGLSISGKNGINVNEGCTLNLKGVPVNVTATGGATAGIGLINNGKVNIDDANSNVQIIGSNISGSNGTAILNGTTGIFNITKGSVTAQGGMADKPAVVNTGSAKMEVGSYGELKQQHSSTGSTPPPTYTVTIQSAISNVTALTLKDGNNISVMSGAKLNEGTVLYATVTPANGYKVKSVSFGSTVVTTAETAGTFQGAYKYTLGTSDIEITATAEKEGEDPEEPVNPPVNPPVDPTPVYHKVTLLATEGATTDPVAGEYQKESWDSFKFYLTLAEGYKKDSKPIVTTDHGKTIEPRESDGAYIIKYIRNDVVISISGIVADHPTANAEIDNDTRIRVVDGTLLIQVPQSSKASITDLSGRIICYRLLTPGETRIEGLGSGMYIVKLDGREGRKVIIK